MKLTHIITIVLAIMIGAGAFLFIYHRSLPDVNHVRNDVATRILKIEGLDSNLSELVLRSRFNIDHNYDALAKTTLELEKVNESFENDYFKGVSEQEDILAKRFFNYKHEMEVKNELVENFKSHNSILRNSEKYAPLVGKELIKVAEKEKLLNAKVLYIDLVREITEYSLHGNPANIEFLNFHLPRLKELEQTMPAYTLVSMIEFDNHIKTVIKEKDQTDRYMQKTLLSDTKGNLLALSSAWNEWLTEKDSMQAKFNKYLLAYIVFILLAFITVVLLLRRLYKSLDREVYDRTIEVKHAYEELKESETLLMQNEKMASLGQLVAGVAHEINTPLGYISSNVNTVRNDVNKLHKVLSGVDQISNEISQKSPDGKKITQLLKHLVLAYRGTGKREMIEDINDLLEDSSYGLNEILELVNSLKDFGRMDKKNMVESNIHDGLAATVKICKSIIGERVLNQDLAINLSHIECMPTQLNQVFMNILNNAIHATDEETGVIEIATKANSDSTIEICFKDNGEGMDEETVKNIFDPFYTTKEVGQGVGLGMSISYKIIKGHGGQIKVESEKGKGTSIIIKLPIQQQQEEKETTLKVVN